MTRHSEISECRDFEISKESKLPGQVDGFCPVGVERNAVRIDGGVKCAADGCDLISLHGHIVNGG